MARELAQYPNREALAEAVVTLLRFQFGCSWVELWASGAEGRMQLMGVSGQRGRESSAASCSRWRVTP